MKQILQDMAKGGTTVTEAPVPQCSKEHLLISSTISLISAGTERMLVGFGKASMLDKARQQPEKVKMVLEKVQTDGLLTTYDAVKSKLAQPLPLGYCNVGRVHEIGAGVEGFIVVKYPGLAVGSARADSVRGGSRGRERVEDRGDVDRS